MSITTYKLYHFLSSSSRPATLVRVMIRAFDGPWAFAKTEFPLGATFGIFITGRVVGDGVILTTTLGIAELIT